MALPFYILLSAIISGTVQNVEPGVYTVILPVHIGSNILNTEDNRIFNTGGQIPYPAPSVFFNISNIDIYPSMDAPVYFTSESIGDDYFATVSFTCDTTSETIEYPTIIMQIGSVD